MYWSSDRWSGSLLILRPCNGPAVREGVFAYARARILYSPSLPFPSPLLRCMRMSRMSRHEPDRPVGIWLKSEDPLRVCRCPFVGKRRPYLYGSGAGSIPGPVVIRPPSESHPVFGAFNPRDGSRPGCPADANRHHASADQAPRNGDGSCEHWAYASCQAPR